MSLKPCIKCGEPTEGTRCTEHTLREPDATERGYDHQWKLLSRRARRYQPFCTDCGATEDLQADHTPRAWARKAEGKPIRLKDIDVVCAPCNRRRGAARGNAVTRGDAPSSPSRHWPTSRNGLYTRAQSVKQSQNVGELSQEVDS